jgi:hypothetical protein
MERSKDKMRPSLTRASDLRPVETVDKPTDARTPDGRFAAGNRTALAARFTATIKKSLGTKAATGEALIVARDARRLFGHTLAALPSDAAPVRALLAIYSRHAALHAYYTVKAEAAGLDTEHGLALLAVADRQSQRAERVLVTVHDLARVHAQSRPTRTGDPFAWLHGGDDDEPESPATVVETPASTVTETSEQEIPSS